MKLTRQVHTSEVTADIMWLELRSLLARFADAGLTEADLVFGFGWEGAMESTTGEVRLRLPLSKIEERVRQEEQKRVGRLGDADRYLSHTDVPFEIQFCHHSDVHILFERPSPMAQVIVDDWRAKGFNPRESARPASVIRIRRWIAAFVVIAAVLTALCLVKSYPYASTIKSRLADTGAANVVRDADALFAKYPANGTVPRPLATNLWPASFARLKPVAVRITRRGVYIECDRSYVQEEGIFVLAPDSTFVPAGPEADPSYERLATRVYFYRVKG